MATIRRWIGLLIALLVGMFSIPSTKAAAEEHRDKVFDQAKRLSDFIGMIVRLAFLFYATLFFGGKSQPT